MAKAEWCPDCGRIIGIGCACNLSFSEKLEHVSWNMEGLPTSSPVEANDDYKAKFPNSKLSKYPPKPL